MSFAKNKGFTLAELMVVFTVVAIIAALLIPTLLSVAPDRSELKAKKAYNTLTRAVETLTNNAPYDANDGILDAVPYITNNDAIIQQHQRNSFFCNNLAELLNVRNANCNEATGAGWMNAKNVTGTALNSNEATAVCAAANDCGQKLHFDTTDNVFDFDILQQNLDMICSNYVTANNAPANLYNFLTPDGSGWIIQKYDFSLTNNTVYGGVTFPTIYATVCVNTGDLTDRTNTTNLYGIGINRAGKILAGRKLQDLIDRDLNNDD